MRPPAPPERRYPEPVSCDSSSRALLLDLVRVLRPPREADPLPLLRESVLRGRLEVLAGDREAPAGVEVDDVAGDHPEIDDLLHPSGLAVSIVLVAHPNLFRP